MDQQKSKQLALGEFVALIALMTSLAALSIDAMLPALPNIGADLQVQGENATQWVVSAMFLGFAIGQIFYGPLSDGIGRKPTIYAGYVLFVVGCVLSMVSTSFAMMLAGRVLQGIGAASARTVSMALVRDQYEGPAMARVMSIIMSVFILVPVVAPALGQGIMAFADWRAIFGLLLVQAVFSMAWFAVRQPETLPPERRTAFSLAVLFAAAREVFGHRISMGYTVVAALVSGAFLGYLTSAQQIFVDIYDVGDLFAAYFAALALSIGVASVTNSALVMRLGMHRLSGIALVSLTLLSVVFFAIAWKLEGVPPLWSLMTYLMPLFFSFGILLGNLNAIAMEPLGHVAGTAAAVIGSVTTFLSLALGTVVSQLFNATVLPLVGGFAIMGALGLVVMAATERGRPAIVHRDT